MYRDVLKMDPFEVDPGDVERDLRYALTQAARTERRLARELASIAERPGRPARNRFAAAMVREREEAKVARLRARAAELEDLLDLIRNPPPF